MWGDFGLKKNNNIKIAEADFALSYGNEVDKYKTIYININYAR